MQTSIVFTPATTPPPGPGQYLVAYNWTHPRGFGPGHRLAPGQLPVTTVYYGRNEDEHYLAGVAEPAPGYRWANCYDGGPLNEFMQVEAWAPMPVYQVAPAPAAADED